MRCRACDRVLNQDELKKKDPETGTHLDTCFKCDSYHKIAVGEEVLEHELEYAHYGLTARYTVDNNYE